MDKGEPTISQTLNQLDFGVEAFAHAVGRTADEVVDNIGSPTLGHLSKVD